jgi:hypothetical protein
LLRHPDLRSHRGAMGRVSVVAVAWADPGADRWSASPVSCQAQARDCRSAGGRDFLWAKAGPVRRGALQRRQTRRPQDEGPTAAYPPELRVVPPQESQDALQLQLDEWELPRAQPVRQVLPPGVAPLPVQQQALWAQPVQSPERLPLEQPALRLALQA